MTDGKLTANIICVPSSRSEGQTILNRIHQALLALAASFFLVAPAFAQMTSDVVPRERLVPAREQLRREIEQARYRVGPFRLEPRFLLRDVGYNNNVFGTAEDHVSDWTATAVAGVHWTLPFGEKAYLRGDALPEYTWYNELADRRFLGGTYNASAIALFERVSLEATVGTREGLTIVSSEIDASVIQKSDDIRVEGDLELRPSLFLFGSAATRGLEFDAESAGFEAGELALVRNLDRDDQAIRAGLRYKIRSFFDVSVAAEQTSAEFVRDAARRDNETEAILVGLHYDLPRFYVNLIGGRREARPSNGSAFPAFSANTGSLFMQYRLAAPITAELYGHRRITFGIFADTPYFLENRIGGSAIADVGQRIAFRLFGDTGSNEYQQPLLVAGAPVVRADDVLTYGVGMSYRLYRGLSLVASVAQSDFDSNLNQFDRSIIRVQTGLVVSGDPSR